MHKICLCKPDYHEEIKYLWLVAHEGSLPGHWPTWYCILDFLKTFPFHNTFFFPAVLIIFCFFKSYWFSFGHIYPSLFNSRIEKYGWLQYLMAVALFPRKSPNLFHPLKHENSPKKFIFLWFHSLPPYSSYFSVLKESKSYSRQPKLYSSIKNECHMQRKKEEFPKDKELVNIGETHQEIKTEESDWEVQRRTKNLTWKCWFRT